MGGDLPKQFQLLGGKSVLAHAVDALAGVKTLERMFDPDDQVAD